MQCIMSIYRKTSRFQFEDPSGNTAFNCFIANIHYNLSAAVFDSLLLHNINLL